MFRINRTDGHSRTVVTVDGYLSGECIEVVEGCCDQALSSMGRVDLYLRDVSVIDQAGRALLSRLAASGVRLPASGVYNSPAEALQRRRNTTVAAWRCDCRSAETA
jgi:hypothetical protein